MKAAIRYVTMPMIECPHCGKTFQWDDYYQVKAGDDVTCQHCEKDIYFHTVDVQTIATVGTLPPE